MIDCPNCNATGLTSTPIPSVCPDCGGKGSLFQRKPVPDLVPEPEETPETPEVLETPEPPKKKTLLKRLASRVRKSR